MKISFKVTFFISFRVTFEISFKATFLISFKVTFKIPLELPFNFPSKLLVVAGVEEGAEEGGEYFVGGSVFGRCARAPVPGDSRR